VLAAPVRAWPAAAPLAAPAQFNHSDTSAPNAPATFYLPYVNRGPVYDVAVTRVELIQGVTLGDTYTTHIAGRPAMLRVFVSLTGASSLPGVSARVQRYVGGGLQNTLTAGPLTVNAATSEGNLNHTFNFNLPASWLTTNSTYVVELNHDYAFHESSLSNNRFPAAGQHSFNLASQAPLNVVVVPVKYKNFFPPTGDLSYLTWMPSKVLPVSQINYSLRSTVHTFNDANGDLTTGSGWSSLLNQINTIHFNENPAGDKLYYGLVDSVAADGCSGGCIAGIGYVSQPFGVFKTSAGFAGFSSNRNAASPTFTHEMGHNFGRRHAPCGNPGSPDASYPYANALIGQWGYDNATGALKNPAVFYDYMSYCGGNDTKWTSDYTYHSIAQSWGWLNAAAANTASAGAISESLLVTGFFAPDGRVQVDPVFKLTVPAPAMPAQASHRLELLDAKGRVLATVPFVPMEMVIDLPTGAEQAASFSVLAPPLPGVAGLRVFDGSQMLYERFASGAAPVLSAASTAQSNSAAGVTAAWQLAAGPAATHYRVRFSPDGGANWHVLELNTDAAQVAVPAHLLTGATQPLLEVQASDGVRSDTLVLPLSVP
jgi:hypothetical protein